MEEFDFTTPINATVIFYDSDDDTAICNDDDLQIIQNEEANDNCSQTGNNSSTKEEKEVEKNLCMSAAELKNIKTEEQLKNDTLETEIFKSIIVEKSDTGCSWDVVGERKSESETSVINIPIKTSLKNSSLEDESIALQITANQHVVVMESITPQTQPHQQRNIKRRLSINVNQTPKKTLNTETGKQALKAENIIMDLNTITNVENDETVVYENIANNVGRHESPNIHDIIHKQQTESKRPHINNQHASDIRAFENNTSSSQISTRSAEVPYHNPKSLTDDLLSQSHNSLEEIIKYRALLRTVSENMIYIISSYQSYIQMKNTKTDPILAKHAKENFDRTKNYFFANSYTAVINHIIPRENNVAFVKTFLNYTIKLAQTKSLNFTYAHMEPLYLELITWVKKRRIHLENMSSKNISNVLPIDVENVNISRSNLLPTTACESNDFLHPYTNHYSTQMQTLPKQVQNNYAELNRVTITLDSTKIPLTSPPSYSNHTLQQTPNSITPHQMLVNGLRQNATHLNSCGIPPPSYLTHTGQAQTCINGHMQQTKVDSPELYKALTDSLEISSQAMHQPLLNSRIGMNGKTTFDSCMSTPFFNNAGHVPKRCTKRKTKHDAPSIYQGSPYSNYRSASMIKPTMQQNIQNTSTEANRNNINLANVPEMNINMGTLFPHKQNGDRQPSVPIVSPTQNVQHFLQDQFFNTRSKQNSLNEYNSNYIQNLLTQEENLQHLQTCNEVYNLLHKQSPQSCPNQVQWAANQALAIGSPKDQGLNSSRNNDPFGIEMSAPAESNRSSTSRDSGFISPLNFNTSIDQLCQEPPNNKSKENVCVLENCGLCALCGKTTKNQCLGCYKCFYCNYDCQILDWTKHKAVCK